MLLPNQMRGEPLVSDQTTTDFPRIYRTVQPELGYEGFIVVDSALNGRAAGGIRMSPHVAQDEVAALARVMTLKFGFANLYYGGAKAGIRLTATPTPAQRRAVMQSFGREFREVIGSGLYRPGEDIGTDPGDVGCVMESAGCRGAKSGGAGSGRYTAMTAVAAVEVLCREVGIALRGATVAVEGFGKVGTEAARQLARLGARPVAVSTLEGAVFQPRGLDLGRLQELKDCHGDACVLHYRAGEPMTIEQMIALDVDVLILAGKPHAVRGDNVDRVRAAVIVPGGNLSITREAEDALTRRGRIVLPDFVANCGGVLGLTWHGMGLSDERIVRLVKTDFARKLEYLVAASTLTRSVRDVAETIAAGNILRMRGEVDPRPARGGVSRWTDRWRRASPHWIATQFFRVFATKRRLVPSTMAAYAKAVFWADRPVYRHVSYESSSRPSARS